MAVCSMTALELNARALRIRRRIIDLAYQAGSKGAHIAPSLSIAEIMSVLMEQMTAQDTLILSKGHGGLGYYCGLAEGGQLPFEVLAQFERNGGPLPGQPSKNPALNIPYSGGSLGMGLPYAVGLAQAKQLSGCAGRLFVLLGDGECNEGVIWEAALMAKKLGLDTLTAIVDCNGMQSDGFTEEVLHEDLPKLWTASGWSCTECDGHDVEELRRTLSSVCIKTPTVVIAHTVKGKGVSFMENNRQWHHSHLSEREYERAKEELYAD